MKKQLPFFRAFSLVELMISLITISCIAAAFTPVITKKLKKQDVALSIAQTSEITTECSKFGNETDGYYCKLCTSNYCITCEKICEKGKFAESKTCTCKNCSEHEKFKEESNDNSETKQIKKNTRENCISCTSSGCNACSNIGASEGKYYINKGFCQNCIMDNDHYCDGINMNQKSKCAETLTGGDFCDDDGKRKSCSTKFGSYCISCTKSECLKCNNNRFLTPNKQKCLNCNDYFKISEHPGTNASCASGCKIVSGTNESNFKVDCTNCGLWRRNSSNGGCYYCNKGIWNINEGLYCGACNSGTVSSKDDNNLNICSSCHQTEFLVPYSIKGGTRDRCARCLLEHCISCDIENSTVKNLVCDICEAGYYKDNSGKCQKCSILNCAACENATKCVACQSGYYLEGNTCKQSGTDFACSDGSFMRVGNLCVTRKNMGDSGVLKIPSTVTVAEAKSDHCAVLTQNCCWKGETATSVNISKTEYGNYNPKTRTVCTYSAAEEICAKFEYNGKKWRLPTLNEVKNWNSYSIGLSTEEGLGFCTVDNYEMDNAGGITPYAYHCGNTPNCKGVVSGNAQCSAGYFWGDNQRNNKSSKGWYGFRFQRMDTGSEDGNWEALGVRCVTEME